MSGVQGRPFKVRAEIEPRDDHVTSGDEMDLVWKGCTPTLGVTVPFTETIICPLGTAGVSQRAQNRSDRMPKGICTVTANTWAHCDPLGNGALQAVLNGTTWTTGMGWPE